MKARTVLWHVTFLGFAINYLIRINLNIAIVAMVIPRVANTNTSQSQCFTSAETNSTTHSLFTGVNSTKLVESIGTVQNGFDWDEKQQGMVLRSFFWIQWAAQLPGGMLAQKFGTKRVFGFSQLAGSLLGALIPAASYWHVYAVVLLRLLQGCLMGLTWPAMHALAGIWIPPNERSKFTSSYLAGSALGTAVMYPLCGLLIHWIGWESVFYVSGGLGVLWFIAWWALVFDSPAQHPKISYEEKNYIEKSLGQIARPQKLKTPWKAMLLSGPLWVTIFSQWGTIWGLYTVITQSPTYFKLIHGWDIKAAGFLSGLPHLIRAASAFLFSILGDYLLRSKKLSRTNVRKLAGAVCGIVHGVCLVLLAFAGCDALLSAMLVVAAMAAHGATSTGPLAGVIDIAPNFSGISMGLIATIGSIPGLLSPAIVGALTFKNQTVGQWQIVWLISGGTLLLTGLTYTLFSDSDVQPWNSAQVSTEPTRTMLLDPLMPEKKKSHDELNKRQFIKTAP